MRWPSRCSTTCSRPDDSVEVRSVRYTFFNSIGDSQAAAAELEQAVLLDPENLEIILMAAENTLRSGSGDTFEPHFWLDQVPRSSRNDPRVLMLQGMVEYPSKSTTRRWRPGERA